MTIKKLIERAEKLDAENESSFEYDFTVFTLDQLKEMEAAFDNGDTFNPEKLSKSILDELQRQCDNAQ